MWEMLEKEEEVRQMFGFFLSLCGTNPHQDKEKEERAKKRPNQKATDLRCDPTYPRPRRLGEERKKEKKRPFLHLCSSPSLLFFPAA